MTADITDVEDDWSERDLDEVVQEVLYHEYLYADYSGYALTVFRGHDGKLYECNGCHCSCYGLEGQWDPEETTPEAIATRRGSYINYQAALAAIQNA
jgi:hypothetical protein